MTNVTDIYLQARKQALACVNEKKRLNEDPYLPVLDHYLKDLTIVKKEFHGIQEIPTRLIIGTCHEGRTQAFAANFMPLLEPNTEFANKWMNLYQYVLDEGLHDSIQVYQLFGHYFVEEGNKRVSITRLFNNPMMSANVIELIVDPQTLDQSDLYRAYLNFRQATGITTLLMSTPKNYERLLRLILKDNQEELSAQQKEDLASFFKTFEMVLSKVITEPIAATSGDAFLLFLEVYGFVEGQIIPDATIEQELMRILPAIKAYPHPPKAALLTKAEVSDHKSLFAAFKEPVKAVLISQGDPQTSIWTATHEQAFHKMADTLKNQVSIQCYSCNQDEEIIKAMEQSIAWGAQVIFTSHPLLLQITNRFAAKYPKVRFLNCSLNPESTAVRSYSTRNYEIMFLQGLAAGALSHSSHIGYIADYPIYGAIADINAFALGVKMVRPHAKVYLDWSTTTTATNYEFPMDIDMIYIAGQEFDPAIQKGKRFGLFDVRTSKFSNLSTIEQKWSVFYTQIIQSILNRTYRLDDAKGSSINYWLGISNGLIDVSFSQELPFETRRMIELIKNNIAQNNFYIFTQPSEQNQSQQDPDFLTWEQLATMNWLVDNIIGTIPTKIQLIPSAEKVVQIHGVDSADHASKQESEDESK
ncbi:MAG: BMP family ABC transporter substrate-binding protein [Erysipelotrichaceae bacterium]|nr:BMP family ABC transporter substrate-binding protein [Erysipelotrichaceae bacterium]